MAVFTHSELKKQQPTGQYNNSLFTVYIHHVPTAAAPRGIALPAICRCNVNDLIDSDSDTATAPEERREILEALMWQRYHWDALQPAEPQYTPGPSNLFPQPGAIYALSQSLTENTSAARYTSCRHVGGRHCLL